MDRRLFVAGLSTLPALSLPSLAYGATRQMPSATRINTNSVRVTWPRQPSASASIFVSDDPAASTLLAAPVQTRLSGNEAVIAAPSSPRPYFVVRTGLGREVRVAERILPLQGGRNFRDLGGYIGAGNKPVKWGRIYRSGVMSSLTRPDTAYLTSLGVSVVCDLRSADERAAEPSVLLTNGSIRTLSRDYEMSSSLASLMGATNRAQAVEAFVGAYMTFITMLAPQFTDMFANLVESSSPVALNCTAGKDRTGVGSALILALLGVDRETIVTDYALSQIYVPVSYYTNLARTSQAGQTSGGTAAQVSPLARLPPEVVNVILGSDPEVMRKTLVRIDSEYGSAGGLAKRRFGVTDAGIAQMRRKYLG